MVCVALIQLIVYICLSVFFFDKHFDVQHCPRVIPIQVFQIRRHLLGFALPTIHWWQTLTIQHSPYDIFESGQSSLAENDMMAGEKGAV